MIEKTGESLNYCGPDQRQKLIYPFHLVLVTDIITWIMKSKSRNCSIG